MIFKIIFLKKNKKLKELPGVHILNEELRRKRKNHIAFFFFRGSELKKTLNCRCIGGTVI